jgi:hypothetical protein
MDKEPRLPAQPRHMKSQAKAGEALYSSPIPHDLGDCIFANRDQQSQYNDRNVYNYISTNTLSLYDMVLKHRNKCNPFHAGNLFETPHYVSALPWLPFVLQKSNILSFLILQESRETVISIIISNTN